MSEEKTGKKTGKNVAIVTGGIRGIGLAISKELIYQGHTVAAVYFGNNEAAAKFEHETEGHGKAFKFDVANFDACQRGCTEIEETMGEVSVLVNNAGITRDAMLHKMAEENWVNVMATNLNSCFYMCRSVVPYMRERGYGRIVNISSINGQKGQLGQTNYSAAKAGMLGFTKALARESAMKGITVNAICPGYIETEMTSSMEPEVLDAIVKQIPIGRMGKPMEIAKIVSFLASEDSGFTTGATFSANGGQYMA